MFRQPGGHFSAEDLQGYSEVMFTVLDLQWCILSKNQCFWISKSIPGSPQTADFTFFEETRHYRSEDKTANMRQIGHPSRLCVRHAARVEELAKEPDADQKRGWNERDPREHKDKQNGLNSIPRVG